MAPSFAPPDDAAVSQSSELYMRAPRPPAPSNSETERLALEAWAQGFHVGGVVLLILLVLCNYRAHVLLHKLVLIELVLALGHGFFTFFKNPAYGWVLSSTAITLYISYTLHNVIAWLKIRPFLTPWGVRFFIVSLLVVQPYWVLEMWANFKYFNNQRSSVFEDSRYVEPLARDPWWVFTTVKLVLVINKNYNFTLIRLIRTSPRFGVMLLCLLLSVTFLFLDIVSMIILSTQSGINPFWRLALVFKCASDVIFLDDFKSVLDHIAESAMRRYATFRYSPSPGPSQATRHMESTSEQTAGRKGSSASSGPLNTGDWRRRLSSKVGEWRTSSNPRAQHREYMTMEGDEEHAIPHGWDAEPLAEQNIRLPLAQSRVQSDRLATQKSGTANSHGDTDIAALQSRPGQEADLPDVNDNIPMVPLKARIKR